MKKFEGKKFFKSEEYRMVVNKNSQWWEPLEYQCENKFVPTANYVRYLKEKRRNERDEYIFTLKSKLEYQIKTYGEVDPIDYQEFIAYLNGTL